jgi:hypothetical protein
MQFQESDQPEVLDGGGGVVQGWSGVLDGGGGGGVVQGWSGVLDAGGVGKL